MFFVICKLPNELCIQHVRFCDFFMYCSLLELIFKCGGRQVDEVINQAQATKGALAAQRSAFVEIQGKLKQLADRFPVVRGLLGKLFGKKLAHALSLLEPYKNLVHGKLIYISKQFW